MPRKLTNRSNDDQSASTPELLRRLVNIAALWIVKGQSQKEQILTLGGAGFSASEIAALLGTTTNTVAVTLSVARSNRKTTKAKS